MYTVKISNIPRWISEIHLQQFFHQCGKIVSTSVAINKDTTRTMGYGYVSFETLEGAENAAAKNGGLLDGAKIKVELHELEPA